MKSKYIKALEQEIENFKFFFLTKYFGSPTDVYWVADDVGGVLYVNDYFFNLTDMMDFVKYNYSKKKMFEYYEYALGISSGDEGDYKINIRTWIKLEKNNEL